MPRNGILSEHVNFFRVSRCLPDRQQLNLPKVPLFSLYYFLGWISPDL